MRSDSLYRPFMLLGREFRKNRQEADLTQEALAAKAKVDRTYISDIENDKVSPTVDMLERLCATMKVRVSTLIACVEAAKPIVEGSDSEDG
ncbi:MAG: helix-turn-helix domain-containing protein [Gemmataceae bacterium]